MSWCSFLLRRVCQWLLLRGAGFDGGEHALDLEGIGERGVGSVPGPMAWTRSTTWCVKPCS